MFYKEQIIDLLLFLFLFIKVPQTEPPSIYFGKSQYYIGEKLTANCTTTKARPSPHITWLINGKKVINIIWIFKVKIIFNKIKN